MRTRVDLAHTWAIGAGKDFVQAPSSLCAGSVFLAQAPCQLVLTEPMTISLNGATLLSNMRR